jgi:hypothetical protein
MESKRMQRIGAAGAAVVAALMVMIIGACDQPGIGATDTIGGSNTTAANSTTGGGMISTRDYTLNAMDDDFDYTVDRYGLPAHCTIGAVTQLTALGSVGKFYAAGAYDAIEPDVYTVRVTAGGGSGVAQIIVTSRNGDVVGPGLSGPLTVTIGVPLTIGTHGVFPNGVALYFMDTLGTLNLVVGESWTFGLWRWTNCIARPDAGAFHPGAATEMGCYNGVDDDGVAGADSLDPTCYMNCPGGAWTPDWDFEGFLQPPPQCYDGFDNNGDGLIDALDPTCHKGCSLADPVANPYMPCYDAEGTCLP